MTIRKEDSGDEKKVKLTPKQELFCLEYIKDFNATRAAKAAGYSENSASEIGNENLRKPQIKDAIGQLVRESFDDLSISKERILNEQKLLAFTRIFQEDEMYKTRYTWEEFKELPENVKACIKKLKQKTSYDEKGEPVVHVELEFYDRQKALETLMRYQSMFNDKLDITSSDNSFESRLREWKKTKDEK